MLSIPDAEEALPVARHVPLLLESKRDAAYQRAARLVNKSGLSIGNAHPKTLVWGKPNAAKRRSAPSRASVHRLVRMSMICVRSQEDPAHRHQLKSVVVHDVPPCASRGSSR